MKKGSRDAVNLSARRGTKHERDKDKLHLSKFFKNLLTEPALPSLNILKGSELYKFSHKLLHGLKQV